MAAGAGMPLLPLGALIFLPPTGFCCPPVRIMVGAAELLVTAGAEEEPTVVDMAGAEKIGAAGAPTPGTAAAGRKGGIDAATGAAAMVADEPVLFLFPLCPEISSPAE